MGGGCQGDKRGAGGGEALKVTGKGSAVPACPARRAKGRPSLKDYSSQHAPRGPGAARALRATAVHSGRCSPRRGGCSPKGREGAAVERGLPAFPALGPGGVSSP